MDQKGNKAIFGIFQFRSELERAVDELKIGRFRNSDISVLMPTSDSSPNFVHEKSTKAPEGAAVGATGGLALGGALGWLIGLGALTVPGVGPFLAAGPIMTALAGAGLGSAVGGIGGGLVGLGIPEYEAKRYEALVKNGGILLSVHVDDSDWAKRAEDILKSCGAKDISSVSEETGGLLARKTERADIRPTL